MPTGYPYTNALADVSAGFPGAVWTPREVRDQSRTYAIVGEAVTAPALDGDGRSIWQMGMAPEAESATVTLGLAEQSIVAWGTTPGAGEVAINFDDGRLELPAGAVGEEYLASYTGLGVPITADLWNRLQVELAATQTVAAANAAALEGLVIGEDVQAWNATLDALAATTPGAAGLALLEDATAGDARTTLGLGGLATQSTVDNGNWSGDALTIANGGTGATTAGAARTALAVYSEGEVDALLAARLPRTAEINTISASTYTLQASDAGKIVAVSATATITIPTGLPTGFQCVIAVSAEVDVAVAAAGGVTLISKGAVLSGGGAAMSLTHLGGESYLGIGDGEDA